MTTNLICIDFVHEITFLSDFWLDAFFLNMRNFGTEYPVIANLVSKVARDVKEKSPETPRRELSVFPKYRAKHGGGHNVPPPPMGIGLTLCVKIGM